MGSSLTFDRDNITADTDGIKYEGYWAPSDESKDKPFPLPVSSDTPWPGKEQFLIKLREKEQTAEEISYRGFSHCRLIGKQTCTPDVGENNGSREYKISAPNGDEIHWPEGYAHYIEVHNVKPSKEFYNLIMN